MALATSTQPERAEVRLVPIDTIRLSGENMRLGADDIDELTESIREHGLLQPLVLTHDLVLVCGHRRLAACRRAGLTDVPCTLREFESDADRFSAMIAENVHRRHLSPLEEGRAFERLMEEREGMTQREVAGLIGKSEFYVSQRLSVLELPLAIQMKVHEGEMSLNEAVEKRRKPRGSRPPEPRDQAQRWQLFYIDKLLRWLEGGHVPLHLKEFAQRLNLLRDALNALANDDEHSGAIKVQVRLCQHPGCKSALSRYNRGDYCGAHEREHPTYT